MRWKVRVALVFSTEPTFSFHSNVHFSIHGTRLMRTNSRVKRTISWMSVCAIRNEFGLEGPVGKFGVLGVDGALFGVDSGLGG
jgi:hypothetical protein